MILDGVVGGCIWLAVKPKPLTSGSKFFASGQEGREGYTSKWKPQQHSRIQGIGFRDSGFRV